MNETRKKIIELIEPFMDKNLSEGCLYEINFKKEDNKISHIVYNDKIKNIQNNVNIGLFKILGHYDITAVLKYIMKYADLKFNPFKNEIYITDTNGNFYIIPNKPLSLYTEEQDKELYGILLKLK